VKRKGPLSITGEKELALCTCGQSRYWPLCDASHHTLGGGGPEIIQLDETRTYLLCQCQRTKTPPYCDGSHDPT